MRADYNICHKDLRGTLQGLNASANSAIVAQGRAEASARKSQMIFHSL